MRDVLYAEYQLLCNYNLYKTKQDCGDVYYPYCAHEERPISPCLKNHLEVFIEREMRKQLKLWVAQSHDKFERTSPQTFFEKLEWEGAILCHDEAMVAFEKWIKHRYKA